MVLQIPNDKQTQETEAKKISILEQASKIIQKAENRVLFPDSHGVKAKFCGEEITLRPLPIKYAKVIQTHMQNILGMPGGTPEEQEVWKKKANEIIIDAFTECLIAMGEFYKKPGITRETIEETMSTTEIKAVIIAQSQINEDSDFLLQPLHIIIALISKSEEAVERVREVMNTDTLEKTLATMQVSVKDGDAPIPN
jgi:hypothetical protein